MLKKKLLIDSVLATGFIFLLIIFFLKVTQIEKLFGLFDPIGQALDDVDFTDLVFSELREIPPANEDIILVNIGELNRAQIASMIQIINQYNPKVVGVDIFFDEMKSVARWKPRWRRGFLVRILPPLPLIVCRGILILSSGLSERPLSLESGSFWR